MKTRLLIASSLLVAACGSGDDAASNSDDLTIEPSGPGGDLTLTISVPAEVATVTVPQLGALGYDVTSNHLHYWYGEIEVQPNTPTRVAYAPEGADGKKTITVIYDRNLMTWSTRIATQPGANVKLELGAMQVVGTLPKNVAIDLDGYAPSELVTLANGDFGAWIAQSGYSPHGPILPLLSDTDYVWKTNVGPAQPFSVTRGHVTVIDETVADPFAHVQVVSQEPKAFPDAIPESVNVYCSSATFGERSALTRLQTDVSAFLTSPTKCRYTIGHAIAADFNLEPRTTKSLPAHRLDIDDVTLTDEAPGTKVTGSWNLSQIQNGFPQQILVGAPTQRGVWLPPGDYHLDIYYQSPRGTWQQLQQDIHLP